MYFGQNTNKLAAAIWGYYSILFIDNKSFFIKADFNLEKLVFAVLPESSNPV